MVIAQFPDIVSCNINQVTVASNQNFGCGVREICGAFNILDMYYNKFTYFISSENEIVSLAMQKAWLTM